jgi:hypothetical protein
MKKFIFSLVISSVVFLIGCQENSITDPVQEDLQKNDTGLDNRGTIVLEGDLADPRVLIDGAKYLTIMGAVKFKHRFEYTDAAPPAPQQYVSLSLSMNAELQDRNSPTDVIWSLSGESRDIIYVSDNIDRNYMLYKYYTIQGNDDGMRLVCRFLVTTKGVDLNEYWVQLQSIDGSYQDIDISVE